MKKKLLAALLVLVMLLTACGFVAIDDDKTTVLGMLFGGRAHGETQTEPTAAPAKTTAEIQTRLIELGFLSGAADGIFGPRSHAALSAFQAFCGLEETGEMNDMTAEMLFGDPALLPTPSPTPVAKGARDDEGASDIKDVQERLIELGYLSGTADGIFGAGTENALKTFQEINGLEVSGVADDATVAALNGQTAMPKPTPEPTPRVNGAKGDEIREIQEALRVMGFMSGSVDGDFGAETERSVKRYQQYIHDAEVAYYEANPTPTPRPTPAPTTAPTVEPSQQILTLVGDEEVSDEPIAEPTVEPTVEPTPEYEPDGVVTDELMDDIIAYRGVTLYVSDMEKGAKGDEVERMQRRLASLWYLSGSGDVDGIFGGGTKSAVEYFQKLNGLEQTGIADEETQLLLFSASAKKSDRPAHMYKLKISVADQRVYAYKWVNGEYSQLVRTMICSTGLKATPTPYGTFKSGGPVGRWYYFKDYDCWAQYGYVINGGIMFHSVLYSAKDESTLRQGSVNALGSRASHGCVRLKVEDAKWIYNNCKAGTTVVVY